MPKYDPSVIVEYTERLYSEAAWIYLSRIATWFFIGAFIVWLPLEITPVGKAHPEDFAYCLAFGLLGVLIGIFIARRLTIELRFKAQAALCQLQIESHLKDMLQEITRTGSSIC